MNHPSHPSTRIARGPFAAVDVCECGVMLVHVGAVTLRMDAEAMSSLCNTLSEAVTEHTLLKHRERVMQYVGAARGGTPSDA